MKKVSSLATVLRSLSKLYTGKAILFAVLTFLTFFVGTPARSQVSTASLNGTVLDDTGALVPGAKIVATQSQTNLPTEATSRNDGSFSIPAIPVGPYVVTVEKNGFATYTQSGILLTVGQVATVEIRLKVGATTRAEPTDIPS